MRSPVGLLPLLAAVLLAGCSTMTSPDVSTRFQLRPDGMRPPALNVEPVYLDNPALGPRHLKRRNTFQYACNAGVPLICQCAGRIGDCVCQCPGP